MKDEKLEPTQDEKSPKTTDNTNYKNLSDALRRDMRDASEELLKLRAWLEYVQMLFDDSYLAKAILQHVDSALLALDCTDHIGRETDEQET